MTEVLLIPLELLLEVSYGLFLVGVSWCGSDNGCGHVAVQLLLKMRLEVLRLVARLVWSLLLRFLHKMLMVWLSCVSSVDLDPYWRWSLELVLVLRLEWSKACG